MWEQRALEDKRLEERGKLRDTEKKIERTVYQRGIRQSFEFATFKNKHIEALLRETSFLKHLFLKRILKELKNGVKRAERFRR